MKCPKCKSDNIQKYQVIHEQGTSNINFGSNTVGGGPHPTIIKNMELIKTNLIE